MMTSVLTLTTFKDMLGGGLCLHVNNVLLVMMLGEFRFIWSDNVFIC